jgi:hypothetical protein
MTVNINQVAITGNLTHDPQLVTLPSGHVRCELQLASHHHARDEITGAWTEQKGYFTVKASAMSRSSPAASPTLAPAAPSRCYAMAPTPSRTPKTCSTSSQTGF